MQRNGPKLVGVARLQVVQLLLPGLSWMEGPSGVVARKGRGDEPRIVVCHLRLPGRLLPARSPR